MSWTTQNPLNIAPAGDGKQTGFTKLKNEFISIYTKLSAFISETVGHTHDGSTDGGKPIPASNIVNTPAGNIVAINVQTAINELDTEKIQIPASIAQGDIIYRGASAFERLPAGTSGYLLKTNGAGANPSWSAGNKATTSSLGNVQIGSGLSVDASGILSQPISIFNETQASAANGGTFTSGAWRQRVLNTTLINQTGATLSSNQITLPAGTYEINASCPASQVNNHKARLQNITDGTTTINGTSEYAYTALGINTRSVITGVFTISSSKVFELEHYCNLTYATYGFGVGCAIAGTSEIFSEISIKKVG